MKIPEKVIEAAEVSVGDRITVHNPGGHLDGCVGVVRGGAHRGLYWDVDFLANGGLFRIPAQDLRAAK